MRRLLAVAALALAAAPVDLAAASREIPLTRAGGVYQGPSTTG